MSSSRDLSQDHVAYLTDAMNGVSRSFALVVPSIEVPLSRWMAVAYLVCRVVDNVEDVIAPAPWRRDRFAEMRSLLLRPEAAHEVLPAWDEEGWSGLSRDERRLMGVDGGGPLWDIYWSMPGAVRGTIARWVREMADGMDAMASPGCGWSGGPDGVRLLRRVADYNRYCYFVAGTVGHMATEMVVGHYGLSDDTADRLTQRSEACGRALQKTNIVKDFVQDLARGVCYLPDEWLETVQHAPLALRGAPVSFTQKVLADVLAELRVAADYVLALPYAAHGYRIASLLCLLPAYETALEAARRQRFLFTPDHRVKISRTTMARCLTDARAMVADNATVTAYVRRSEAAVSDALGAAVAS